MSPRATRPRPSQAGIKTERPTNQPTNQHQPTKMSRLQLVAYLRHTLIPDFIAAGMGATADAFDTALQFPCADGEAMHDARKALLAAIGDTPAGTNAATLCADAFDTVLQFLCADGEAMHDARKALLAATAHTPAGTNAATLCANSLAELNSILDTPAKG